MRARNRPDRLPRLPLYGVSVSYQRFCLGQLAKHRNLGDRDFTRIWQTGSYTGRIRTGRPRSESRSLAHGGQVGPPPSGASVAIVAWLVLPPDFTSMIEMTCPR